MSINQNIPFDARTNTPSQIQCDVCNKVWIRSGSHGVSHDGWRYKILYPSFLDNFTSIHCCKVCIDSKSKKSLDILHYRSDLFYMSRVENHTEHD